MKEYKGYTGRNPKTGKPVTVKAKRLPFFKPELHQRLLGPLVKSDVEKRESASPELSLPGKELIGRLSFSHFVELLQDEFD